MTSTRTPPGKSLGNGNPHCDCEPWDDSFIPLGGSLEGWLQAWIDGGSLFRELLDSDR